MNKTLRTNLDNLWSKDRQLQNKAFTSVLTVTDRPVDWAYEVWDERVRAKALALIEVEDDLEHRKNYTGVWRRR
jgi:hypothetical protein